MQTFRAALLAAVTLLYPAALVIRPGECHGNFLRPCHGCRQGLQFPVRA